MILKYIDRFLGTRLSSLYDEIKADNLFNSLKFDKAVDIYERLFTQLPDKKRKLLLRTAICYRNIGKLDKANLTIRQYDSLKDDPDYILELARIYNARGSEKALGYYHDAFSKKKDKELLKEIGEAYLKFGRSKDALEYLCDYFREHPLDSNAALDIAKVYFFSKDFEKCDEYLDIYEGIQGKDDLQLLENRGLLFEAKEDYENAAIMFKGILEKDKSNNFAFEHLIFIFENTSKMDDLLNILLEFEKVRPNEVQIKRQIASIYKSNKSFVKARTYYEILIDNNYIEKDFILEYIDLAIEFKDYRKAEKLISRLTDSGFISREESAPLFAEVFFKSGRLKLMENYLKFVRDEKTREDLKKRLKGANKDLLYCLTFKEGEFFCGNLYCDYVLIDSIRTDNPEIWKNFIEERKTGNIIYFDRETSGIDTIDEKLHFSLSEVSHRLPVKIEENDIISINDLKEFFNKILGFFRKNTRIFKAFLFLGKDDKKDFFFFIRKFIEIKVSSFEIHEFLEDINKEDSNEERLSELPFIKGANPDIFDEDVMWVEESTIDRFRNHIAILLREHSEKFLIMYSSDKIKRLLERQFEGLKDFVFYNGDYICLQRFVSLFRHEQSIYDDVVFWLAGTKNGSLKEINIPKERKEFIKAGERNCLQLECPYYEKCFFQSVKKKIFSSRFIISDVNQSEFFKDKIESAIFFPDAGLLKKIFKTDYVDLSKMSDLLNTIELYFEINLKNNSDAFQFYRELKENIIKINRLIERILEYGPKQKQTFSCSFRLFLKEKAEVLTLLRRMYSYFDVLRENLYTVEKYINERKLHFVELNHYRGVIATLCGRLKKVLSLDDDHWIEFDNNRILFQDPDQRMDEQFKKRYYFNIFSGLNRSFTILRQLLKVDKWKLDFELEESSSETLYDDRFINHVYYRRFPDNVELFIDLYQHIYEFIGEDNSDYEVFESIVDKSVYRDLFHKLYSKRLLKTEEENIKAIFEDFCFSGKLILLIHEKGQERYYEKFLKKNGFSFCSLTYDDSIDSHREKIKALKKGYFRVIMSESVQLVRKQDFSCIINLADPEFRDENNFVIVKEEEAKKEYDFTRLELFTEHVRHMLSNENFEYLTLDELALLFFDDDKNKINSYALKHLSNESLFSSLPEINITGMHKKYYNLLYRRFYGFVKNKIFKLKKPIKDDESTIDILLYLYKQGNVIARDMRFILKKELGSAEEILLKHILKIIELFEYFNTFNEVRVFDRISLDYDDINTNDIVFYWMNYLEYKGHISMIFGEKIEIRFNKKIENIIKRIKIEFEEIAALLRLLVDEFGIDINTYTSINIFELLYENGFEDMEKLKMQLYALNYMNIIMSEPINMYYSRKLRMVKEQKKSGE